MKLAIFKMILRNHIKVRINILYLQTRHYVYNVQCE